MHNNIPVSETKLMFGISGRIGKVVASHVAVSGSIPTEVALIYTMHEGLIKRVMARTECAIGEEQCGFRQGRGCMDQVFALRQVCEKYLSNGKDVLQSFMDLEQAYVTINRHGM